MRNTIFSIHKVFHYNGHVIKAEKRSLLFTMEYSLMVDGIKQDQILGTYGILTMHGSVEDNGLKKPFQVVVKQKTFTAKFHCYIDDKMHKMEDFKYDEL
ncbi:hypothetical protein ACFLTE_04350 [Bacteroidota bacterium]